MDLPERMREWRFACQSRNHRPRSITWNDHRVRQFTAWAATQDVREVEQVTASLVHRFLASLSQDLSDYTRRGYAQAVKAFLNYCACEDLIPDKLRGVIAMPRVTHKVIQTFTPDQVRRLLSACEQEVYPWMRSRNRAIIAILLDTGLRASNCAGLHCGSSSEHDDSYLQVIGKGLRSGRSGWANVAVGNSTATCTGIDRPRQGVPLEPGLRTRSREQSVTYWLYATRYRFTL